MPAKIFVSYSKFDLAVANLVAGRLDEAGHECWLAARDAVPGRAWPEQIIDAITGADVFLLVFSEHANASDHVANEVRRAFDSRIPILPLRIEDVVPVKSLDYFINQVHWLDAIPPPVDDHVASVAKAIDQLVRRKGGEGESGAASPRTPTKVPPAKINALFDAQSAAQVVAPRPLLRGALASVGLGLVALVALLTGLGPPSMGAGWLAAVLALILPLGVVLTGFDSGWNIRWLRNLLIVLGGLALFGYLWSSSQFIFTDVRGREQVRGWACTEEAMMVFPDDCPALDAEDFANAGSRRDMLWTQGSINGAEQLISGSWILTVIFAGIVLGGYVQRIPRTRGAGG